MQNYICMYKVLLRQQYSFHRSSLGATTISIRDLVHREHRQSPHVPLLLGSCECVVYVLMRTGQAVARSWSHGDGW